MAGLCVFVVNDLFLEIYTLLVFPFFLVRESIVFSSFFHLLDITFVFLCCVLFPQWVGFGLSCCLLLFYLTLADGWLFLVCAPSPSPAAYIDRRVHWKGLFGRLMQYTELFRVAVKLLLVCLGH